MRCATNIYFWRRNKITKLGCEHRDLFATEAILPLNRLGLRLRSSLIIRRSLHKMQDMDALWECCIYPSPFLMSKPVFIKLRSADHRWSAAVLEEKVLHKLYQILNESKIHPYTSVMKLLLLVDFQRKTDKLVLSITSCLTLIIL
jgi:hypothetical protein